MIGVEDQYLFSFSVGEFKDFIEDGDLAAFTIVEEAGGHLPTYTLVFNTTDERIFSLLNEKNDIQLTFGKSQDTLQDTRLSVFSIRSAISGQARSISIVGFFSAKTYLSNTKIFLSDKSSALSVLNTVAATHFSTPSTNVQSSSDSQVWVQPNISDKKFVRELWLHADLGSSFPAIGITVGGDFLVKDVLQIAKGTAKYRFSIEDSNPDRALIPGTKQIAINTDYVVSTNTSLVNHWVGYGREFLEYQAEAGEHALLKEQADVVMAMTRELDRTAEVEKKFLSAGVRNDNHHGTYNQTKLKNLARLASFSNVKIELSFDEGFEDIKVLDLVMFNSPVAAEDSRAAEFHSGLYVVNKVARTIHDGDFTTVVEICRESLNSIEEA